MRVTREILAEIEGLPTISSAQADDLKADTGEYRLWLSRVGRADGAARDNDVSVEHLEDGRWVTIKATGRMVGLLIERAKGSA